MREDRGLTPAEDEAMGCVEEGTITKVEPYADGGGWSVSYGDCWGCGVRDVGVEPKVGDHLVTYGRFGRPFHGQAINGVVLWYRSPEEMDEEHRLMVERMNAERRAEFEAKKDELDADYESLPALFRMRIDRFRAANPDFRWEYEPYEMFTCTQAVVLADWARAQADDQTPGWKDRAVAALDAWWSINSAENDPPYDYQAQKDMIPGWGDGHSGNTAGCALMLAKQYLTAAESVAVMPGAMSPIVGTADYSVPS